MSELTKMTLAEASRLLKNRTLKSEELTRAYIDEIQHKDGEIGAYIHYAFERAVTEAKAIDERLGKGEQLGALAGIPMGIKDNISTVDMPTTCGSKMLEGYQPPFDATVVKQLKSAGSVVLGKLNMDEFAMGSTTEHSYFKKTKNPVDIERVPGGSSGGSAAAVASDQAVFTLGSDTGGSIRQPASFCGVVGMKPTYGSISRYGLVAFASSLDQIGPFTKSVEDMALILETLMAYDPKDSTSQNSKFIDQTAVLSGELAGMKIALPKEFLEEGIDAPVKDAIIKAAKVYESMGAKVDLVSLKSLKHALPAYYIISSAEASSNLARFDGIKYGYRHDEFETLEQLYSRSRRHGFGKEVKRRILLGTYALSSGYYDAYYKKALKVRTLIVNEFDALFSKYDLVLSPVAPTTAYKFGECSDDALKMYLGDIYTVPVNIAGLPSMSLNCGFNQDGLPIGMQLIGQRFDETTILRAGHAYETQVTERGGLYGREI